MIASCTSRGFSGSIHLTCHCSGVNLDHVQCSFFQIFSRNKCNFRENSRLGHVSCGMMCCCLKGSLFNWYPGEWDPAFCKVCGRPTRSGDGGACGDVGPQDLGGACPSLAAANNGIDKEAGNQDGAYYLTNTWVVQSVQMVNVRKIHPCIECIDRKSVV